MIPIRSNSTGLLVFFVLACLAVWLSGCGEDDCNRACVNLVPDTRLTAEPPVRTCDAFSIKMHWTGEDMDGSIDGFEIATLTAGDMSILLSDLEPDALVWGFTTALESTFTVALDSCCISEGGSADSLAYWIALVRAVDNRGARDPQPEVALVKACNVLPKVRILQPDVPEDVMACLEPEFMVEWEGEDPDGDEAMLEYKYILLVVDEIGPGFEELPPISYEGSGGGHGAPPIGMWSEWVPADCTYVSDLEAGFVPQSPMAFKCVFVTARDGDGGVLPRELFSIYNQNANWFHFCTCYVSNGVELIILGDDLGRRSSRRPDEYLSMVTETLPGSEVSFTFLAHESPSTCEIATYYRYYYDDPTNPETSAWDQWVPIEPIRDGGSVPAWWVSFPEDGSTIVPEPGLHRFVAEIKDACGVLSHCEFRFEVLPCSRPRGICLVDDDRAKWLEPSWGAYEEAQDFLWEEILDGYDWQELDTGHDYTNPVPLELICGSRTVIWIVDQNSEGPWTGLLQVCAGNTGNYLGHYVETGGNLIVIGRDPVYAAGYWPDGTPEPWRRGDYSSWDFRPRWNSAAEESVYHWMWKTFGIAAMKLAVPPIPFTALWPCEGCHPAFTDAVELGPQASRIDGEIHNAAYITRLREGSDVVPLYSTALKQGDDWIDSGGDNLLAVYVPAQGRRGHAAWIGAPEYWFNGDQTKAMIRQLLELFGEVP